jgi:hypothetical protein
MSNEQIQTIQEVAVGIFFAVLNLYDKDAEAESVQLLRDMVSTGVIRDPNARSILSSIARSSTAARAA